MIFQRSFPPAVRTQQRGVALFVVIVFVMMSMLLALWGSRTSLFTEMVVGNDADYQRAFEAAQALLQDAEMDIRSAEPGIDNKTLDGVDCSPRGNGNICRIGIPDYQIPASKENEKVGALIAELANQTTTKGCYKGLCTKRAGAQDFWNDKALLQAISVAGIGARYGDYTGAQVGGDTSANPILANRDAWNQGGWYWIEVLPYIKPGTGSNRLIVDATASAAGRASILQPNLDPNVIYRITAVAYGRKLGDDGQPLSMAVLQQTYAQQRRKD